MWVGELIDVPDLSYHSSVGSLHVMSDESIASITRCQLLDEAWIFVDVKNGPALDCDTAADEYWNETFDSSQSYSYFVYTSLTSMEPQIYLWGEWNIKYSIDFFTLMLTTHCDSIQQPDSALSERCVPLSIPPNSSIKFDASALSLYRHEINEETAVRELRSNFCDILSNKSSIINKLNLDVFGSMFLLLNRDLSSQPWEAMAWSHYCGNIEAVAVEMWPMTVVDSLASSLSLSQDHHGMPRGLECTIHSIHVLLGGVPLNPSDDEDLARLLEAVQSARCLEEVLIHMLKQTNQINFVSIAGYARRDPRISVYELLSAILAFTSAGWALEAQRTPSSPRIPRQIHVVSLWRIRSAAQTCKPTPGLLSARLREAAESVSSQLQSTVASRIMMDSFPINTHHGEIHFIVVVDESDRDEAIQVIHYWKRRCFRTSEYFKSVLFLFNSYVVSGDDAMFAPIVPFRTSLLQINKYIDKMVTRLDVVSCLIGIDAVRSWVPQLSTRGTGVIPLSTCMPGSSIHYDYALPSLVLFAFKNVSEEYKEGDDYMSNQSGRVFCRAFVGIGWVIGELITSLLKKTAGMRLSDNLLMHVTRLTFSRLIGLNVGFLSLASLDSDEEVFSFSSDYMSDGVEWPGPFANASVRQLLMASEEEIMQMGEWYTHLTHKDVLENYFFESSSLYFHKVEWIVRLLKLSLSLLHVLPLDSPDVPLVLTDLTACNWQLQWLGAYSTELFTSVLALAKTNWRKFEELCAKFGPFGRYSSADQSSGAQTCISIRITLAATISSLQMELGTLRDAEEWSLMSQLPTAPFSERYRSSWVTNRLRFSEMSLASFHVVTCATRRTEGLSNLELSMKLSGLNLEILCEGEKYSHVLKLRSYLNFLNDVSLGDDDVVMFVDAYDVLIYPAVRRIGLLMAESNTPITYCAENGQHPHVSDAWTFLQVRGGLSNHLFRSRHINSGCIVGRVKELKYVFSRMVQRGMRGVADDQHGLLLESNSSPHLLSVDDSAKFFHTGYKLSGRGDIILDLHHNLTFRFSSIPFGGAVSVIHFNGKGRRIELYDNSVNLLKEFDRRLGSFQDEELSTSILSIIHALWDRDCAVGLELLYQVLNKLACEINDQSSFVLNEMRSWDEACSWANSLLHDMAHLCYESRDSPLR